MGCAPEPGLPERPSHRVVRGAPHVRLSGTVSAAPSARRRTSRPSRRRPSCRAARRARRCGPCACPPARARARRRRAPAGSPSCACRACRARSGWPARPSDTSSPTRPFFCPPRPSPTAPTAKRAIIRVMALRMILALDLLPLGADLLVTSTASSSCTKSPVEHAGGDGVAALLGPERREVDPGDEPLRREAVGRGDVVRARSRPAPGEREADGDAVRRSCAGRARSRRRRRSPPRPACAGPAAAGRRPRAPSGAASGTAPLAGAGAPGGPATRKPAKASAWSYQRSASSA